MTELDQYKAVSEARDLLKAGSPWRLAVGSAARVHGVDATFVAWHAALARASQFEARRWLDRNAGHSPGI